jgi:hypothetical protein
MDTHQYESGDDAERMWHAPTLTEDVEKLHGIIYLVQNNDKQPAFVMFKPHPGRMFSVRELSKILSAVCAEEHKFFGEKAKKKDNK